METDIQVRHGNLRRKKLPCLRCGRAFWTDRCHRTCARCHRLRRLQGSWDFLTILMLPPRIVRQFAGRRAVKRHSAQVG